MIQVDNVSFLYGEELALQDINLTIDKNSTCAIIGPSGCGKTTLLYTLAGLLTPTKGNILIDHQELTDIRQDTGLILQDYGLLPWKTVWSNIALGLQVRRRPKAFIAEKVATILAELGLTKFKDKYPTQLSGGQRQRVAIGRSLALEPDLLLMDEPTSALDAITKEHFQNLILKIYQKNELALALVTHNIDEAVFLGQKIVIMGQTRIRHIIENPYFGEDSLREKFEYYKICLEVRRWMDVGDEPWE